MEMSYMSLLYECPGCKQIFDTLVKRSEREEGTECPLCGTHCQRDDECITSPNVTRASFVDGRSTDTAKKLKEAARLKSEMYNLRPKDRANHQAEVNKLTKIPK
jgi:DNA-directed RNA polymerase subunit RPC12/RpoP